MNFGPGYATVLTTDVKATFSDKLGTVGGTFGIFLGVSFLSLFELFDDIFKWVKANVFLQLAFGAKIMKPKKSTNTRAKKKSSQMILFSNK